MHVVVAFALLLFVTFFVGLVVLPVSSLILAALGMIVSAVMTPFTRPSKRCDRVPTMCVETLAKQAYDAYTLEAVRDGSSPSWNQLSRDEQRAWCAAAKAVAKEVSSEDDEFEL